MKETKLTKKDYALHYFDNDLIPIPLCWAVNERCACFMEHTDPKQIGKAPLVKYTDREISRETVAEWFMKFPNANIGILLRESGLVVIDADSADAVEEFEKSVWDASLIPNVKTGRGKHYYFRANRDTPAHRMTHKGKSQMIDIFSNGFIVAPPSIHKNGHRYVWNNPPKNTGLPIVPPRIEEFLRRESARNDQVNSAENIELNLDRLQAANNKINLDELPLNDFVKSIIRYGEESPFYKQRGYKSPSEALYGMILACYRKGLTDSQIVSIFTDSANAMSYKYKQKKSLVWLTQELKRAKKIVVPQKRPFHQESTN